MCGIFGYVLTGSPGDRLPSLDTAIETLRHRGPDGQGTFMDTRGEPACGLAHTRLAIIDLSPGGKQPMTDAGGRWTVVFNGEIYNYREIRAELEGIGECLRTGSDTEVILHAYARWGSGCLSRLRGMFAFAIWDARERALFLARDRLGVKPLYVARLPEGVIFASEVRAVLATNRVGKKLDTEGLTGYLAFGSVREPRTIVRGIQMLPAGSFAILRNGQWSTEAYWQPPLGIDRTISHHDAVVETRALLQESVALRLVSDVPVGIFLSGGMDSGAIVAIASEASVRPVHTFTVTFDEGAYDESVHAQEMATRFGTEHHVVNLSSSRALHEIDDALAALDQPSADGINTYFVAKAVREAGLAVALSGIGGDELFAGYRQFRSYRNAMRVRRLLGRLPSGIARIAPNTNLPTRARKALDLLGSRGDPFQMYAVARGMFSATQIHALLGPSPNTGAEPTSLDIEVSRWACGSRGDALGAFSLLEVTNYLRNTLLRDTDVMGMAHALEVREPLLDHRLAERLFTLPGTMKIARSVNKPLLAEAVPELPAATSRRRKAGFTLPLEVWLRGPLQEWAKEKLPGAAAAGLDSGGLARVWESFLRRRLSFSRVWTLIALADWCRRHQVSL